MGHYKWFEMRMFELMAGWIATVPELDIKIRLGAHSYHHAFHSELWHKRLPELREMNPDRKTVPPNPEFEVFVEALGAPEGDDKTIEKLVGMYRVALPAVIATYTYHRNNTSQITDSPTIRSLNFCLNDDLEEWVEAEMTIQSLITSGDDARDAPPITRPNSQPSCWLRAGSRDQARSAVSIWKRISRESGCHPPGIPACLL